MFFFLPFFVDFSFYLYPHPNFTTQNLIFDPSHFDPISNLEPVTRLINLLFDIAYETHISPEESNVTLSYKDSDALDPSEGVTTIKVTLCDNVTSPRRRLAMLKPPSIPPPPPPTPPPPLTPDPPLDKIETALAATTLTNIYPDLVAEVVQLTKLGTVRNTEVDEADEWRKKLETILLTTLLVSTCLFLYHFQ